MNDFSSVADSKPDARATHTLTFNGGAGEFTRIWWTNLLLTVCTLGIYSAWAKVRTRKWFYGNTVLAGSTFNYHADPKAILKGRLIVVGVYVLLVMASEFLPLAGPLLFLLVFALLPWVLVRSLRFNALNTSYRGLRMDFSPDNAGAYGLLLKFFLVPMTLGLAWPWWRASLMRFLAQHRYGTAAFTADVPTGEVYGVYFRAAVMTFLLAAVFAVVLAASGLMQSVGEGFRQVQAANAEAATQAEAAERAAQAGGDEAYAPTPEPAEYVVDDAATDATTSDAPLEMDARTVEELEAMAADGVDDYEAQVIEAQVAAARADAALEQEVTEAAVEASGGEGETPVDPAQEKARLFAVGMMVLVFYGGLFVFFLFVGAYIDARLTNLLWSRLRLGDDVTFTSTLRARDLAWLRVTNFLLCVVTLFIAWPVTQVRNARYRLSRMTVEGDLDHFVAGQGGDSRRALGEEASDLLDLDIAL